MTFIASVISKKGAVLIADSLGTTELPVLNYSDFAKFLKSKPIPKRGKLKIASEDVSKLFKVQPSYTRDFQEKLFKYTHNTAISVAGSSVINKPIDQLIEDAIKTLRPHISSKKTIDDKIKELKDYITKEAIQHLAKYGALRTTILILTHYMKSTHQTRVFKLYVNNTTEDFYKANPKFELVTVNEQPKEYKVICEGQNRISERILFGDIELILDFIPKVVEKIIKDFKIKKRDVPKDYVTNLMNDNQLLTNQFFEDIKMSKIKELSIQQAYDLACLLMRIERDIQKYTENIPTVGGVVKIAKIDDKGFAFITGDGINHTEKF